MQEQKFTCSELHLKLKDLQQEFSRITMEAVKFSGDSASVRDIPLLAALLEEAQKLSIEVKELDAKLKLGNLREILEQDYRENEEALKYFERTDEQGNKLGPLIQESKEYPGRYEYIADYDGTEEIYDGQKVRGWNVTGRKFLMPTFTEIFALLKPRKLKLYREMKEQGWEPKLQLTPIAYKIETLGRAIDSRLGEINILKGKTYIASEIKDHELIYEPGKIEAIDNGKKIKMTGGITKSDMIKRYQGWEIEFVSDQQVLEPDPDSIGYPQPENELTNAQKLAGYHKKNREKGMCGLGFENELMAQMRGLRKTPARTIENETVNIMLESCVTNNQVVACSGWSENRVDLYGERASNQDEDLRCRRSVRILKI